MKIYYFTGTGNSLKIAKDIASQSSSCELISIPKLLNGKDNIFIEGNVIGFVFPVYFARPPVYIQEFIEKVEFGNISYMFAVMNGGGLFGRAMKKFEKQINKKGKKLNAGFIISMPGNHPMIASMQRKKPEEHYKQEEIKINEIVRLIKDRKQHKMETNLGIMGGFIIDRVFNNPYKRSQAKELDKEFHVNDNCSMCGTCIKVCPVGNIVKSDTKHEWQNRCVNCASCYHHCRSKAILLGKESGDFRYRHPEIELKDIINSR